MSWVISLAASSDSWASFRTSVATTAKPRPCSPARAASMAAFRARRLVWLAIWVMASTMRPIAWDCWPRASIAWPTRSAAALISSIRATMVSTA